MRRYLGEDLRPGLSVREAGERYCVLSYAWDPAAPIGNRVDPASIMLNGVPVGPAASYRVTVNSFLADGGDNFTVLRQGTNRLGGDVDLDALEKYLTAKSPVAPGPQDRIALVP